MAIEHPVAIFWDYENCRPGTAACGFELVQALQNVAHEYGWVKTFKAYLEIWPDNKNSPSPRWNVQRSELQCSGVTLVDTPHNGLKEVADQMLMVDMLAYAIDTPAPSTIILVSGDKDFAYAAAVLRQRKYRVVLISKNRVNVSLKSQVFVALDWNTVMEKAALPVEQQQSPTPPLVLDPEVNGLGTSVSAIPASGPGTELPEAVLERTPITPVSHNVVVVEETMDDSQADASNVAVSSSPSGDRQDHGAILGAARPLDTTAAAVQAQVTDPVVQETDIVMLEPLATPPPVEVQPVADGTIGLSAGTSNSTTTVDATVQCEPVKARLVRRPTFKNITLPRRSSFPNPLAVLSGYGGAAKPLLTPVSTPKAVSSDLTPSSLLSSLLGYLPVMTAKNAEQSPVVATGLATPPASPTPSIPQVLDPIETTALPQLPNADPTVAEATIATPAVVPVVPEAPIAVVTADVAATAAPLPVVPPLPINVATTPAILDPIPPKVPSPAPSIPTGSASKPTVAVKTLSIPTGSPSKPTVAVKTALPASTSSSASSSKKTVAAAIPPKSTGNATVAIQNTASTSTTKATRSSTTVQAAATTQPPAHFRDLAKWLEIRRLAGKELYTRSQLGPLVGKHQEWIQAAGVPDTKRYWTKAEQAGIIVLNKDRTIELDARWHGKIVVS